MSDIDTVMEIYASARAAILAHVGYVEDWCVFPIEDSRDQSWAVDAREREWVRFSPQREAIAHWLADPNDDYGSYGNVVYQNVIYTQRHLPKWVYRGQELTLVVADTRTDGNKFLQIFRNANEVRIGAKEKAPAEHPLVLAIDRMIDADREKVPIDDIEAKIRTMCAEVPLDDLHVAIKVHRANCHQHSCPVLATMEAVAILAMERTNGL